MPAALLCRRVVARVPPGVAALPARLRIAHLLDTADLRPPGLPPRAVLLIRRVVAARPLALDGFRAGRGWEAATRARIADWHRRALRPRGGRVPRDAEAVLFADEAEWLAALACAEDAGEVPWWSTARGAASIATPSMPRAAAAWQDTPREMPAAVARLVTWGALRVLARWPTPVVARLRALLVEAFALPATLLAHARVALQDRPAPHRAVPPAAPDALATRSAPSPAASAPPAIVALLSEPGWTSLPPATRGLVILAMTIAQTPRALRSPDAPHWVERLGTAPPADPREPAPVERRARPAERVPVPRPAPISPRDLQNRRGPLQEARDTPPAPSPTPTRHVPQDAPPPERPGALASPPVEASPQDGVATRLGGLFLLLDLVLRAGLPDAFAKTLDLPARASGWAMLELLGRALLGAEHAQDPAWRLLAELDGRDPDAPLPPLPRRDFRIPADWIPDGDTAWTVVASSGRLRILHGAGDVILDRRIGQGDLAKALRDEAARLCPRVPATLSVMHDDLDEAWRRLALRAVRSPGWPSLAVGLVPCLLAQAGRRLGCDRTAIVPLLRDIARRPARLHATPAHLDLVFALDAIALPARRAGLDADPGWAPALMRVVRFHFE